MEAMLLGLGIAIGSIITTIIFRPFLSGTLRIDTSDERPYLFLELSKGVDTIANKKYILLKVNLKNYIPHE